MGQISAKTEISLSFEDYAPHHLSWGNCMGHQPFPSPFRQTLSSFEMVVLPMILWVRYSVARTNLCSGQSFYSQQPKNNPCRCCNYRRKKSSVPEITVISAACNSSNYINCMLSLVQLLPIVKRHKVQLLLSGHDHNFQHIQNATNANEIDYVISGGGGRGINNVDQAKLNNLIARGLRVPYFGFHYGFVDLVFTLNQLTVRYVNSDGTIPYQFTRGRSTDP